MEQGWIAGLGWGAGGWGAGSGEGAWVGGGISGERWGAGLGEHGGLGFWARSWVHSVFIWLIVFFQVSSTRSQWPKLRGVLLHPPRRLRRGINWLLA